MTQHDKRGAEKILANPPRAPHQRHARYSVRYRSQLDAATLAMLEELAVVFHRKRSAILPYAMQWELAQTGEWTVDMAPPGAVRAVGMLQAPERLQ